MYKALYRKWRPMSFDDVISQPHITSTLRSQVRSGKTAHAYLFTGSRGTGKTTCARILAKAVNCPNAENGVPCLTCDICRDADRGTLSDIIEIDAASNNSVEDIRDLREGTVYMPERCSCKVYIIDEVHMLSPSAWGALLKVMEEPPAYVKFILATTEIHKVPATIISRCQRYDFRRIRTEDIAERLRFIAEKEQLSLSEDAAFLIAKISDGGMRDAISLLDQCAAVSEDITAQVVSESAGVAGRGALFDILEAVTTGNAAGAIRTAADLYSRSKDMARLCEELTDQMRNVMLLKLGDNQKDLLSCMPDETDRLSQLAARLSMETILSQISELQNCRERMQRSPDKRIELEMTLISLAMPRPVPVQTVQQVQPVQQMTEQRVQPAKQKPVQENSAKEDAGSAKKLDPKDFRPVENWMDILEEYRNVNPAVSGSLAESSAFVNGNYMLIVTSNRFFLTLLKNRENAISLRETVKRILGKEYKILGKCSGDDNNINPAQSIIKKAIDSNIETAVE
ncbi:MAG: DNA polymerase III subunit gamma/tau [Oscillospiraceae bacterium]|nr:DNA polymerase III subunit gamma/tau [Oscillospiraceae bacterium]